MVMVPGAGLEPARCCHQGIFLPATAFAAAPERLWGLDFTFAVAPEGAVGRSRQVSTLFRQDIGRA